MSATFDCAPDEREQQVAHFEREGFARWLAGLRAYLHARLTPTAGSRG